MTVISITDEKQELKHIDNEDSVSGNFLVFFFFPFIIVASRVRLLNAFTEKKERKSFSEKKKQQTKM